MKTTFDYNFVFNIFLNLWPKIKLNVYKIKTILILLIIIFVLLEYNYSFFIKLSVNKQFKVNGYNNLVNKSAFLVNTINCRIIRWPLLDSDVIPLFENKSGETIECETNQNKHNITIERFDFNGIQIKNPFNRSIDCFAQTIRRVKGSDNQIEYSEPIALKIDMINYFRDFIAVKVNCSSKEDNHSYHKVVPLIPKLKTRDKSVENNLPNILLLGMDSVSRLNFDRHLLLAKSLVSDHQFYTMYGYNKVGDNTFPNLTPLLTGYYAEDIWNSSAKRTLDYFPFIWKNYKNKGFSTFYMEDAPFMNTFNFNKRGFSDAPTDYYLRPFFKAMDSETKNFCYLDKPEVEVYYEYLYDFIKAMNLWKQKYFVLHFMVRLTHNYFNCVGLMDPFVTKLMNRLFDNNLLSNTVLIFFSDHGMRFGTIRETLSGKYEERLPFLHIYVPKRMKNENLTLNQNRLTSPFDIYATLTHIIKGEPDYSLKYGQSLLELIPETRSFKSIPISEHWCVCQTSHPIKDLSALKPVSGFIVETVNQLISEESKNCAKLYLEKTLSAFEQRLNDKVLSFKKCNQTSDVCSHDVIFSDTKAVSHSKHYLITIKVSPSNALFEATVNYNMNTTKKELIGDISRINLYGNQSNCINDSYLKKYCFCKDFV